MYDASLQSLESGIAQSAPQPAAELMQQADVVENRLGEVYEAAGVSKGYTPETNTSNPLTTSEASDTDVGTLFGDYFDAIGADDMPPFAQFEKMYREGGDAWKELSLKMGWKEALKSGAVEPFTRFEDYKATAGVDGNGGMGYNELEQLNSSANGKIKYYKDEQLKTEPNKAFFWSGNSNGIGGMAKAAELAKQNNGITLEMLLESQGIDLPKWDFNDPVTIQVWENASASYAEQASGEVRAIIGSKINPDGVWNSIELPILKENQNVSKIIVIDPETLVEKIIFMR